MKAVFLPALAALLATSTLSRAAVTLVWNFSDDNLTVDTGAPVNFAVSDYSIGNSLGTVADPVLSQSVSSGYAGATGTFNIGNAMRIGALNTAAGGSGYFEVTITPDAGYAIEVIDFDFGTRSTTTAAQAYSLRSSTDGYATDITTGTITNNSTWAFKDNTFVTLTATADTPVTLRLYGYNGAGSPASGTINSRLDDISIIVNAVAVPEPGAGIFALGAAGLLLRRRRGC